ncbi:hypothetical protein RyT2_29610 [Pseudolactococcus yaeyamensis]
MIENFGKNLIKLRQKRGISQVDLANELQIGKQSISDYEKQKTYPTFANLEKIAVFFNATPTQLFGTSQEQELELSAGNIDEYQQKAREVIEAGKVINDLYYLVQSNDADMNFILASLSRAESANKIINDLYNQVVSDEVNPDFDYILGTINNASKADVIIREFYQKLNKGNDEKFNVILDLIQNSGKLDNQ